MVDDDVEAKISAALAAARSVLEPMVKQLRKLPGGEAVVRSTLEKIAAETEANVRRAIFADRMDASQRARAEACLQSMRRELEALTKATG